MFVFWSNQKLWEPYNIKLYISFLQNYQLQTDKISYLYLIGIQTVIRSLMHIFVYFENTAQRLVNSKGACLSSGITFISSFSWCKQPTKHKCTCAQSAWLVALHCPTFLNSGREKQIKCIQIYTHTHSAVADVQCFSLAEPTWGPDSVKHVSTPSNPKVGSWNS